MRILLVDDEHDIHRTIGGFMADMDHQVLSAYNAREALRQLETHRDVEIVLSDVRMPGMDGIRFLQAIRMRFPGIPVVLMTGHGDESIAVAALQNGAYDYIKKPLKLKDILGYIARIDARNRLEAQILRGNQRFTPTLKSAHAIRGASPAHNAHKDLADRLAQLKEWWPTIRACLDHGDPADTHALQQIRREWPLLLAAAENDLLALDGAARLEDANVLATTER